MEAVDIFIHNFSESCWPAQQCVPSLAKGHRGGRWGGKICVNVDVRISSKPFVFLAGVYWSVCCPALGIPHFHSVL